MPKKWTAEDENKLLLGIIKFGDVQVNKVWPEVAEYMGGDYTVSGIRQHFQKLRRDLVAGKNAADKDDEGTGTPKTDKAPKLKTTNKRRSTDDEKPNKKGRKRTKTAENLDSDEAAAEEEVMPVNHEPVDEEQSYGKDEPSDEGQ